ncbi:thrombospondin type-1 domain-containing protein 4 [Pungitius pungitius]|uniref:thrombospondin type-1 domain-containing protein 4 n=1 Tax=Pungitius pungitius TaxID=134920 RepID=UPI002E10C4F4
MAGLGQQLRSPRRGRALALLHLIGLLYPPSGALPWDTGASPPILESFRVVRGNFSRTFLRFGYHKITEIPAGARDIIIRETVKSRNYLALRTQNGLSVVNGNWVIDRQGNFTAAGAQLTYQRPNEIRSRKGESITAVGPLTEDLHVYLIYQQPGPSIHYEYIVPLRNTRPTTDPEPPSDDLSLAAAAGPSHSVEKDQMNHRRENNHQVEMVHQSEKIYQGGKSPQGGKDQQDEKGLPSEKNHQAEVPNNDIIKETQHPNLVPSDPRPTYVWTKSGHSACSATCGSGRRQLLWGCVERDSETTVPADLCDPALEPTNQEEVCSDQPCPAYWDLGEWSECSRRCGPGTQHRQVICRQVTHVRANGTETSLAAAEELCGSPDRPPTSSTCQLKICSQWEMRSEWSPCSVPCGVGQRSRQVVCVSNQGDVEEDEECNANLKPDTLQNCDMGACARSWFTSLWSQRCSAECGQGNRTRTALCLMDHVTDLPLDGCEGDRPQEATACESGPCLGRLEWYTGAWGQCSAECGNGTQTRPSVCIFSIDGRVAVADPAKCSSLSQPITAQPCRLKPCGVQWYVTDWSACSRSCGGGYRVREVRCLADTVMPSDSCDPGLTPEGREECNKQPCGVEINPSCSDQYHNCPVVVQARLCVYTYYRSVCCSSCSRALKSYPSSLLKNHIGR